MAKNKQPGFFSKLLSLFSSGSNAHDENTNKRKKEPKSLAMEWAVAIDRLQKKLLTKQVNSGLVLEKKSFRLTKNNQKLFRIEGEDYSVLLVTGNHLYKNKEGKMTGVLFVDEGELNQKIQSEITSLDQFLERMNVSKTDLYLDTNPTQTDWREVLKWERFWKEQLVLQMHPNDMALTMLSLGEDCKAFFESVATDRQKKLVRDELFYLNVGNENSENPHAKTKTLYGFSAAVTEFGKKIQSLKEKREKEKSNVRP
ncbi:hypothetical protein P3G55_11630 [Leptospira sp. 96542]|nr:hypothetical protein [Leptospira sp. 96542]